MATLANVKQNGVYDQSSAIYKRNNSHPNHTPDITGVTDDDVMLAYQERASRTALVNLALTDMDNGSVNSGFDSNFGPAYGDDEDDNRLEEREESMAKTSLPSTLIGRDFMLATDTGRLATAWYPRGSGNDPHRLVPTYETSPPDYSTRPDMVDNAADPEPNPADIKVSNKLPRSTIHRQQHKFLSCPNFSLLRGACTSCRCCRISFRGRRCGRPNTPIFVACVAMLLITAVIALIVGLVVGLGGRTAPSASSRTATVVGSVSITNWLFVNDLINKSSADFAEYSSEFCTPTSQILNQSDLVLNSCIVTSFSSGSVIVTFSLQFSLVLNQTQQSVTAEVTMLVANAFIRYFDIGWLSVDGQIVDVVYPSTFPSNVSTMTTATTTTMNGLLCPVNQFTCVSNRWCLVTSLMCRLRQSNYSCSSLMFVCDGYKDCLDNSDEWNCSRSTVSSTQMSSSLTTATVPQSGTSQTFATSTVGTSASASTASRLLFVCTNGRTVLSANLCNGFNDCGDFSDENIIQCPQCSGLQYQCTMALCVNISTWCDGSRDCPDGSNNPPGCQSQCPPGTYLCQPTGQCLLSSQRCNNVQDCPDRSDEINCTCLSYQYACINGPCIYKSWLCDGVKDCPLGDDEGPPNCPGNCNSTQFQCISSYVCIDLSLRCDGVPACSDASDEVGCVTLNATTVSNVSASIILVTFFGVPGYVLCADQWSQNWSDATCVQMGYPSSSQTSFLQTASSQGQILLLTVNTTLTITSSILSSLQKANSCNTGRVVALQCTPLACGTRSSNAINLGPYIIDGQGAAVGAWPWQAAIFLNGQLRCGASLVGTQWLLTAAHCVSSDADIGIQLNASSFRILLGSVNLTPPDPGSFNVSVDLIIRNPYFGKTSMFNNDLALLHVSTAIPVTNTVRPICLPNSQTDMRTFRVCVDTGFGLTSYGGSPSNHLMQARMGIISYNICYAMVQNLTAQYQSLATSGGNANDLNSTTMFCVGTVPTAGDINFCQGDSGGPMMCENAQGTWTLVGINAFVYFGCDVSVVMNIAAFIDWIQTTIASYS